MKVNDIGAQQTAYYKVLTFVCWHPSLYTLLNTGSLEEKLGILTPYSPHGLASVELLD
jgi:hypothetical protein